MARFVLAALSSLLLALVVAPAHGWNATGHRVTAWIAWDQMTPEARKVATRILRAHPRYEDDLLRGMPEDFDDPDRWAFATAAVWPDFLRAPRHPDRRLHRPDWHFVNYAFAPDGDTRGFTEPDGDWGPGQHPENALQAIRMTLHDLADPDLPDSEKALALCWYLHVVGDLHQPLHAVALVSHDFPEGDRGGNLIAIEHRGVRQSLHSYWDDRLGGFESPVLLNRVAERVTNDNPLVALGAAAMPAEPEVYALESLELARDWVYLNGHLATSAQEAVELPAGYDVASAAIARRRVAQAGYRMGARLNEVLADAASDPAPPGPAADGELMQPDSVFATPTGGSYHLGDCRFVQRDGTIELTLEEAAIRGLAPCGVCRPPVLE